MILKKMCITRLNTKLNVDFFISYVLYCCFNMRTSHKYFPQKLTHTILETNPCIFLQHFVLTSVLAQRKQKLNIHVERIFNHG